MRVLPEQAPASTANTRRLATRSDDADAGAGGFYNGGALPNASAAHIGTESSRTVEVPDATVGFLLAGGGKQIKALEDATGCRVVVDRSGGGGGRARGGGGEQSARKVTLIGSDAGLREAERRLQDAVSASGKFIEKTIRINATQAGAIIGRGGAVVKRLQAATSTHISVNGRGEGSGKDGDAPRTVSIRGVPWNVDLATRFIFAAMRDPGELEALMADAEAAQAAGAKGGGGGAGAGALTTGGGYGDAAAYAAVYGK